jgi:hypothetical protein
MTVDEPLEEEEIVIQNVTVQSMSNKHFSIPISSFHSATVPSGLPVDSQDS